MASTNDIRDIMDMGRDGSKSTAPKKKKKIVEHLPKHSGLSREVQALMGDSVPPVAIVEGPKYKSKPSLATRNFKPRHWEERSFEPRARTDGLVLRHWKRARVGPRPPLPNAVSSGDIEMTDAENVTPVETEPNFEDEFPMDKWNVKIDVPSYTDEQYDAHFKSEDWTREETDYLLQLVEDFDLRWMLIADRYSPEDIKAPAATEEEETSIGMEVAKTYPERNMEALKTRYYQLAAKDLELKTPASNMTQTEFQLWEKMRNFDAKTETTRKNMAEKLFERTKDEAEEERTLLEELYRITKNEEDFIRMRKDLYSRLEAVPSLRRNERGEEANIALYQTSAGLTHLFQSLLKKEQRLKRPTLPNGEASSATGATPVDGRGRHPGQAHRRDTLDSHTGDSGHQKKGSISQPVVKQLTPAEEAKYGVSHPTERLTSGVTFRHEKINRVTTAKSQVQTQKINAALTELEIPPRLSMPTERVCREFERLVQNIQLLLDARKTLTRVQEEVKILEETRRQRLGLPAENPPPENATGEAMDVDKKPGDESTEIGESQTQSQAAPQLPKPESHDAEDDEEGNADESMAKTEGDEDDDHDPDADGDDDDADGEDQSAVDPDGDEDQEEEEEEEDDDNEVSFAQQNDDEDENEPDQDDDEDDNNLQTVPESNAASDEEDAEEEEDQELEQEDEDAEEGDDDEDPDLTAVNGDDGDEEEEDQPEDDDDGQEEVEEDEPEEPSRPNSSGSAMARSHKRSASVISDASKAGSNRSGFGRKRKK